MLRESQPGATARIEILRAPNARSTVNVQLGELTF
jgi:hypothetical protein